MERYHWNILGISETRWKDHGETTTNDGHLFYYSGKDDKHGVGFLIHKDTVNSVMGCRPVSSRIITIRIRANPFNITIIQAYAPTSDYADTELETFYEQLPEVFDETPKKGILIVQHRCQPSRNRAGNPAFLLISRIPAFLRERPAFLALFRNNKNR